MARHIDIDGEREELQLVFPYDPELNARVKTLPGCYWNGDLEAWCVSVEHLDETLELLEGEHFKLSPDLRAFCEERDTSEGAADEVYLPAPADTLSIREANLRSRAALKEAFDDSIWIVGELQSYDRNDEEGHAYFELVQRPDEEAEPVARIQAVLFDSDRRHIRQTLDASPNDVEWRDGLAVRLRGRIDLYAERGSYQIVVEALDPAYTAGRIQRRRQAILDHLDEEGMLEDNRARTWPVAPLRVALITSHGSDAYNDFREELEASGYGFQMTVCDAYMQGDRTEASVLRALEYVERHSEQYDAIAIVRGGGARSDLAYFDTEAIGEAICSHPVKVLCGVGHERDTCLLDHVAESHKTPTAAAQRLVGRVEAFRERIDEAAHSIFDETRDRVAAAGDRLEHLSIRLQHRTERRVSRATSNLSTLRSRVARIAQTRLDAAQRRVANRSRDLVEMTRTYVDRRRQPLEWARRQLREERLNRPLIRRREHLEHLRDRLVRRSRDSLDRARRALDQRVRRLRLMDPQRVLERGFAIVRRQNETVRSVDDLKAGDSLEIRLADGRIDVTVDERRRDRDDDSEPTS